MDFDNISYLTDFRFSPQFLRVSVAKESYLRARTDFCESPLHETIDNTPRDTRRHHPDRLRGVWKPVEAVS